MWLGAVSGDNRLRCRIETCRLPQKPADLLEQRGPGIKGVVRLPRGFHLAAALALICPLPHAFRLGWTPRQHVGVAAEPALDLRRARRSIAIIP